ncbi:type II and III secretion system protein family protein [Ferrimonas kyonanensis]|uniref:type II and III secretion system protein family protein n=1 Tax=Ferrimonas kyonanensis TaxID=364763 RepID=UPI00041C49A0|nr:pilus assembly protein N-terminal domain-containing protein [Ferrimonas kyonanensis]
MLISPRSLRLLLSLMLLPWITLAADRALPLNDAVSLGFDSDVGTVFISQPSIADYKVLDNRQVVVFGQALGQARLIVYGKQGQILLSELLHVDLDLAPIQRQLSLRYPELSIQLDAVGEQVAIRGTVFTTQQRDEIYALVAGLLGRERIDRFSETEVLEFDNGMKESGLATFHRLYTYQGIVEGLTLDRPQQVNVKISVAQVTDEFNETIGVDWSSVGQLPGTFTFDDFKAADLSTIITALGDDSLAEVLAEPNLTVISGESASFLVGGEVPIIVTNSNSTTVTFKEFGIGLDLTAKVLSDEQIRLQLAPEVSAIEGYVRSVGIEVPQLSSRRAMTTIELGDGDSFMLGGLMNSEEIEELSRVPLLGDIPYLGSVFRKSTTTRRKTELVIIATVNLVKPSSPDSLMLPHIQRSSTLSRWFNIKNPTNGNDTQQQALTLDLLQRGGFIQ